MAFLCDPTEPAWADLPGAGVTIRIGLATSTWGRPVRTQRSRDAEGLGDSVFWRIILETPRPCVSAFRVPAGPRRPSYTRPMAELNTRTRWRRLSCGRGTGVGAPDGRLVAPWLPLPRVRPWAPGRPGRLASAVHGCRAQGAHRHFVAVEDGVAVGRVSVNLKDPTGSYLFAVHVPPEHEGRGVCRRMLAVLMRWLEEVHPRPSFVLTSNAFNDHAHRAYRALGFEISETRWHFDREIADALWRVTPKQREPIQHHIRFQNGRWQIRTHIFRRQSGAAMQLPERHRERTAS